MIAARDSRGAGGGHRVTGTVGAVGSLGLRTFVAADSPLPAKKDVARALLLRGTVFLYLDPRVEGVSVPPWLRNQPQLVLQIGLDMPVPMPDLRVDDEGVYGTLSFQRSPYPCRVAWESVFALTGDDGRGMVWPDDMPPEIAAEVDREASRRGAAGQASPSKATGGSRRRPELLAIRGGDGAAKSALAAELDDGAEPSPRSPRAGGDRRSGRAHDGRDGLRLIGATTGPSPAAVDEPHDDDGIAEDDASREPTRRTVGRRRELPPYLRVIK